jgi:flagellar motor switch protein FliN/FliY
MADEKQTSQAQSEQPLEDAPGKDTATLAAAAESAQAAAEETAQDELQSPAGAPTAAAAGEPEADDDASLAQGPLPAGDVEYLLNQAERALESIDGQAPAGVPRGATAFRFEEFSGAAASTEVATLDLLRDVELDLRIELGRTHMYLEEVLRLRKGSVVPLDKLAGDPVDIYVNGRLIARGEVLVLNDNFCVRVTALVAGASLSA